VRSPGPAGTVTRLGHHGPVVLGFLLTVGALAAYWLGTLLLSVGSLLVLIVVALFLAAGLNPAVEFFVHRNVPRTAALLIVIGAVLLALVLFFVALVPVITDQVASIASSAPGWLDDLQRNRRVQRLEEDYQVIEKVRDFVQSGDWASGLFGGVVGVGLAVLGFFANAFIVTVLTLYFLASFAHTKRKLYELAPASKRARVHELGDRIVESIGGYVAGAFVVAMCAGISSLVFLLIVGLAEYAVALAAVVALLDVIPMIGATLGAIVVSAIGMATDVKIGIACVIFYIVYQQFENYVIYPRVMQRSVDVPGAVIVIAAMVGAGLLGVIGALLAIPTAAAILLLVKELWLPRQEAR
jgi:predicted PurR-regulated permease PerM